MHTIAFFPATYNLAETTRTIQVAKACREDFNVSFAGHGGQFEELVEREGFSLTRLSPRLSSAQIEHLYKVDQGEKLGAFFTVQETRDRVESELRFLETVRPLASVTGFNVTVPISCQAAHIPLVWLTQSTWDFNAIMDQDLGSYIDDLDLPALRWLPETSLKWLTKWFVSLLSRIVLKPLNTIAKERGVKPFMEVQDIWKGSYNLMAEPDDFSGLKGIPPESRFVGPLIADLNIPVPQSVQRLRQVGKPLVYFAMGSSGRPKIIKAILEGFKDQPFQVVSPMKSSLKELQVHVPNNVLLTDWLPALEVSRLADISVIHGGIGTVMTAALAGKPVVGIGMMPEQEYNIDCLVRKGFAARIRRRRARPQTVNKAILTLLADDDAIQKAAECAKKLKVWLNERDQKIKSFFHSISG
jgi:hypothetical protein